MYRLRRNPTAQSCRNERRLLDMYYKKPSPRDPPATTSVAYLPGVADRVSSTLLAKLQPAVLLKYSPRATLGDGNSLYRAVSLGVFSVQQHHEYIRLLTAFEMIENPDTYDVNSVTYERTITDNRVVCSSYADLVRSVTSIGAYAEMLHIYAVSAVIKVAISSYCPTMSINLTQAHPCNLDIFGRGVMRSGRTGIDLMWTVAQLPSDLCDFVPNHFVFLARVSSHRVDMSDLAESEHDKSTRETDIERLVSKTQCGMEF